MIYFSDADVRVSLKGRTVLKAVLKDLFQLEGISLKTLRYVFCSDEYVLQINRDFLQHDYYTDIITFEMSENPDERVEGEVYISVERVRENARDLKVAFRQELLRVIFHGALHLCGYKDKTSEEQGEMRKMEDKYLLLANGGECRGN
jgi:probable rRNA maturation factor